MTDELVYRDHVIQSLSQAVAAGMGGIRNVPGLLRGVLEQGMWRERYVAQADTIVRFDRFEDFVTAHPPEGLGTEIAVLKSIIEVHGPDVKPLLLAEIAPLQKNGTNQYTDGDNNIIPINGVSIQGDSPAYKLARLKRDNPDLAAQVISGELSAHAAAVQAGFANPKVSVRLDNLESAAGTLCRKLDRAEVLELIDWLYKTLGEES